MKLGCAGMGAGGVQVDGHGAESASPPRQVCLGAIVGLQRDPVWWVRPGLGSAGPPGVEEPLGGRGKMVQGLGRERALKGGRAS